MVYNNVYFCRNHDEVYTAQWCLHDHCTSCCEVPTQIAMVAVLLKKEHGYILLLVLLMVCVNTWAAEKVDKARKHYGIHYPQMYAEKGHPFEKEFNCVQRAHQNMLEALPLFLALLFTSSIYRPGVAAICGLVRILGFIVYVHGYSSGDPEKRVWGAFGYLGFLGFLGLTFEGALKLL